MDQADKLLVGGPHAEHVQGPEFTPGTHSTQYPETNGSEPTQKAMLCLQVNIWQLIL